MLFVMFWNHQCSMYSFTEATFFLQIPGEGTQHFPAFCKYKEGDANMEFQSGKYTRGSSTDLARWRCRIVEEQTNPVGWQGTGYLVSGNYHANINVHSIHRVFAEEQVSEERSAGQDSRGFQQFVLTSVCIFEWGHYSTHTTWNQPGRYNLRQCFRTCECVLALDSELFRFKGSENLEWGLCRPSENLVVTWKRFWKYCLAWILGVLSRSTTRLFTTAWTVWAGIVVVFLHRISPGWRGWVSTKRWTRTRLRCHSIQKQETSGNKLKISVCWTSCAETLEGWRFLPEKRNLFYDVFW